MTSTATAPTPLDAPGAQPASGVAPRGPEARRDESARRRRSRFPVPDRPAPATRAQGPQRVRWAGSDATLRELVRDHATAAGAELTADLAAGPALCTVIDGDALEHAAWTPGAERLPLLVVTARAEVPSGLWRSALGAGAHAVLPLPGSSEELLSLLADLARPRAASLLIGVAGGCGGAGASSFAARLAAAARAHGPVTLLDADPLGGGLDLLVEAPGLEGLGWEEAAGLGADDGEALRDGLPRVDEIRLLVARDHAGPDARAVARTLTALAPLGGTVVVDLAAGLVPAAAEHLDELLVVVPGTDHAVRSAARRLWSWQLPGALARAVVRRSGPLSPAEVCEDLAVPLAASFRDGPRGTVPLLDVRRRGADRAARGLLAELTAEARP